jgi:ribosomal protein S27E
MSDKQQNWQLGPNPQWADAKPPEQPFTESACCDHSHFITVECRCGEQMHMHESATRKVPRRQGVASACKGCGELLLFPPGTFSSMFKTLRRQGWII